jgi:hypothetical protein
MGRQLPTECAHGRIVDWGDFGDEPEHCSVCDFEDGVWSDETQAEMAKDSRRAGLIEGDEDA